jgi:undecaprenyl-diphosphatase
MHDYLLSFLLGVIEGLTEFIPVSSTAHLRIAEALLGVDLQSGFWKMYSIVIQLGAILALTAFVVTAIPAFLLSKLIGKNLESLTVMASALLVGGIIMWVVDSVFVRPRVERMEQMSLPTALWIGAVQTLSAIFPGTSRSMCTIAAGQVAGMSREAALEFSFFLSIPTMFAATGYDLLKTLKPHHATDAIAPLAMTPHLWLVLAIGFVVAFLCALAVVAWFLRWVRRHGFAPFAIYRIILGLVLLIALSRGLIAH